MNTSFMTAAALPQGIQALRGWIGIDQYDEENLVGQRMLDRFEARFGYRPQNFWSVLNYDFANIIAHGLRSEEHTSELQSLMRISYAVFCLKKKKKKIDNTIE